MFDLPGLRLPNYCARLDWLDHYLFGDSWKRNREFPRKNKMEVRGEKGKGNEA